MLFSKYMALFTAVVFLSFDGANITLAETDPGTAVENDAIILAHEGASKYAPENTLAAFRAAKEAGADGFETDIQMTKDHQLVICHDDYIASVSNGDGKISELTLEELKTFDFGSWFGEEFAGEQILTLEECLAAAGELDFDMINLELKPTTQDNRTFVRTAADIIRASGMSGCTMVSSFDHQLLKEFKEYAPEVPVEVLTIPNLSAILMFNLSELLPEGKPISDYTAEDVENLPEILAKIHWHFS